MTTAEAIRQATQIAFEEGIDEFSFVKMAKAIAREENQKRTEATAAQVYGQRDPA